ncbi:MAG: hypothetical protein EAZ08_02055 [Cytophagales bacterium]|nr:MAG: hypothetical protein EAZ08_02055 [Cytophagales bacterium]
MSFDVMLYTMLPFTPLQELENYLAIHPQDFEVGLPEIWLSLLALVLGTLIIVISIASQSTPKLIDIYLKDSFSLSYVWFITAGSLHNLFVDFFITIYIGRNTEQLHNFKFSALLNSYVMLPIALTLAIPYILYILRYTQTKNVVDKIYKDNKKRIQRLRVRTNFGLLSKNKTVSEYQFLLFEGLNQLDDLLKYVDFKEPKSDIINKVSLLMQQYLEIKATINPRFFKISPQIRGDISFKTITEQFQEIEEKKIFYEHKTYRQFSNAYWHLIEKGEFDLASMCVFEIYQCGRTAVEQKDDEVIKITLIRFNTILRFGIKHGLRENDARNIYNAIFYYGKFLDALASYPNMELIKQGATYMNIYLNEVYRHSLTKDAFVFLVDVFAWELKRVLVKLHENQVSEDLEREILSIFLKVDNLGDVKHRSFSTNIRILQTGLALYYLRKETIFLADVIIRDIMSDLEFMNVIQLKNAVESVCKRIETASPTFWEDTDRGNLNLYFSEDKMFTKIFLERFYNILGN